MNIETHHFPNVGYFKISFTDEELKPLTNEIEEIRKNKFNAVKVNHELAGNIEKEFKLTKCKLYLQNLILPLCIKFDEQFNYMKSVNILTKDAPVILDALWVNFQSKHEFNPNHIHSGVFSFVIWIEIPYDIEKEKVREASKNSNSNCPGHFEFAYTNSLGKICFHKIPADKKFKNQGLLFTSNMSHGVHPFFTSDDYRISVSGNFKIDNSKY